jgi:hypothetical protein
VTAAAPRDYAPTARPRRRWIRYLVLTLVLGAFAFGLRHRTEVAGRVRLGYWQHQCLTYTRPPGTPLYGATALEPECWRRFNAERSARTLVAVQRQVGPRRATLFLHERTSPGGNRRLVRVQQWHAANALTIERGYDVTVIAPGTLWRPPKEVGPGRGYVYSGRAVDARLFFAQPDPADPSRFSFDFTAVDRDGATRRGTVDARLNDDDTVTFELRDPATTRGL